MPANPPKDTWVWGNETIVWGFDPAHRYTFKIIEPQRGRPGCMSLQYHHEKSETWLVLRGQVWALFALDDQVCTRIMRPGDIQNIVPGVIHRLAGISADVQLAEPSTPDVHAADKSKSKDVVRLHCVHGRAVVKARNVNEQQLVDLCIKYTDEALDLIEQGKIPPEHNVQYLTGRGAWSLGWN